jgi:hypothetical protein
MCPFWVNQPDKPSFHEVRESNLSEDKLGVKELHLICKLLRVNLGKFALGKANELG